MDLNIRDSKNFVEVGDDIGYYWRASIDNLSDGIYVNKESREEAIEAIKHKIDQYITANEGTVNR